MGGESETRKQTAAGRMASINELISPTKFPAGGAAVVSTKGLLPSLSSKAVLMT
jgi:hypothetical protein